MKFNRYGKSYQMVIDNGQDLSEALSLDEALWMALSAPSNAFNTDPAFISFLDVDADGRITTRELRDGIRWLLDILPDCAAITKEFDGKLPLASISTTNDAAKAQLVSAKYILQELKAKDTQHITLEQVRSFVKDIISHPLNGDGVLTTKATTSAQMNDLLTDVIAANGGKQDIDGSIGIDEAALDSFLADVPVYLKWLQAGKIPQGQKNSEIMVLGADTPALDTLLQQHAGKIDQFFQLSKLLRFDSRLASKSLSTDAKLAGFDPAVTAEVASYQDALPIATPQAECLLSLDASSVNPAYRDWFEKVVASIIRPILGAEKQGMTAQEWAIVCNTFNAYHAYVASKAGASVAALSEEKLAFYSNCAELTAQVKELIKQDKAVADILNGAKQLEKLLLFRTYIIPTTNNFISFTDLYDANKHAMFECGKMVIDGRWFSVVFKVDSPGAHQACSKNSLVFLIYAEVDLKNGSKMNVVAPVTSGSKGNLVVGKRGLFYDLNGQEYDAKLVGVVENPICIREAIFAPVFRLWGLIEGKLTAWSGDSEKRLQANFAKAITPDPNAAKKDEKAADTKKESKMNSNAFMGIGIAAAAIGSSLAFISKTLASMSGFQIWMMVLVAILAVMLPFSIIAMIKLNKQDISSILEGCGWSINLKVGLNSSLRKQFTYFGRYPKDAQGTPRKRCLGWLIALLLIILACYAGCQLSSNCKKKCTAAPQEAVTAPAVPAPAAQPASEAK